MEEGDQPIEEIPEEEEEEEEEREEGEEFSPRQQPPKKKPCNQRIDELATPNKRIFLALWNEHAYHFPKDKVNYLKHLLQKLYALSPEETAKYFTELRSEARAAEMRRSLKSKLRKYLLARYQQKQRQRAFNLFNRLLKCGISYSARNPVPPLVSIRLRYLADVILEQLCALRRVDTPNRAIPDKLGEFLIAVSDWIAIAVERLFFAAQVAINQLTSEEPGQSMEAPSKYEDFAPGGVSTPQRLSLQDGMQVPKTYAELSHPVAPSTPYQKSTGKNQKVKAPQTYSEMGYPAAASAPRRPPGPGAPSTPYQKTSKSDVNQGTTSSTFGTRSYDEAENQGQQLSDRPSLNPYYSFVAPVATSTHKTILPPVMHSYNYKTMKYPPGAAAIFAKSQFEVPYGFEKVPKRGTAKNSKEFTSQRRRKRKK